MNDLDREKLLGYLMNALEADEIAQVERELLRQPQLRNELAELQEELSPLTYVYESIDPPKDLAKRTCKRVWDMIDKEERIGEFLSSPTVPDRIVSLSIPVISAEESQRISPITAQRLIKKTTETDSPETNDETNQPLQHASLLEEIKSVSGTTATDDTTIVSASTTTYSPTIGSRLVRRQIPAPIGKKATSSKLQRIQKSTSTANDSQTTSVRHLKHKRLIDILTSVGIGILIAVIAFPAVNFAKNQAQSIVTQNKINELNKSAVVYAPHQNNDTTEIAEESKGVNLAQSGWQEVVPNQIPLLNVGSNSRVDVSPSMSSQYNLPNHFSNQILPSAPVYLDNSSGTQRNNDLFLGQAPEQLEQVEIDPQSLAYQTLISNVSQTVSLGDDSRQSPSVQTAFGQNVLFQNGRVFFRILPVFEQNETVRPK